MLGFDGLFGNVDLDGTSVFRNKKQKQIYDTLFSWVNLEDPVFLHALDRILNTRDNLSIVGPGGVGKSILLKMASHMLDGNTVVLSTTGVSSANLAGDGVVSSTLHSFFHFPAITVFDGDYTKGALRDVIEAVDTILIDEVSMLNASCMEAVLRCLSVYRRFSEKDFPRIILFGDTLQLPPVINQKDKAVAQYFNDHYFGYTMFFMSVLFQRMPFETIHLHKIYRQKDNRWKQALDNIRMGKVIEEDIDLINTRLVSESDFIKMHDNMMYLVCTNERATALNEFHLDDTHGIEFEAQMSDSLLYGKVELPPNLPRAVTIAPGMQIMCLHNNKDKGYQNGTLARATEVYPDRVVARKEDGSIIEIGEENWEFYEYVYNKETDHIEPKVVGTYSIMGCKPAFAVTIYKSQGLTLNSMLLDPRGVSWMAPGLLYVALSRCTTLEGVGLTHPIKPKYIRVNQEGLDYLNGKYPRHDR